MSGRGYSMACTKCKIGAKEAKKDEKKKSK